MAPRRGGNERKPMKRSQMNKNDQKPAYKIVSAEGEGATSMDVEVTWSDGRTERIIGFASEPAAREWIAAHSEKHGKRRRG
jgi:hypothetical protein